MVDEKKSTELVAHKEAHAENASVGKTVQDGLPLQNEALRDEDGCLKTSLDLTFRYQSPDWDDEFGTYYDQTMRICRGC